MKIVRVAGWEGEGDCSLSELEQEEEATAKRESQNMIIFSFIILF